MKQTAWNKTLIFSYDGDTGVFTCTKNGLYRISSMYAVEASNNICYIAVKKIPTLNVYPYALSSTNSTAGAVQTPNVTVVYPFGIGDGFCIAFVVPSVDTNIYFSDCTLFVEELYPGQGLS